MFSLLSSRPGRPPKRGVPFPPMSPQDAMMHLKNMHNGAHAQAGAGVSDPYKDGPFPKGRQIRNDISLIHSGPITIYTYHYLLSSYQNHSAS